MKAAHRKLDRLEAHLAGLLHYGSLAASAVVGLGLILVSAGWRSGVQPPDGYTGMDIVTAGIALFILLPVLRVSVMLIVYVRERDYRYAAIAATVLAIILLGCAVGMLMGRMAA